MDFILMLTHRDRTVETPLEVLDTIRELGLCHIGFKDVGVAHPVLEKLTEKIRAAGATSYMEVVSTEPGTCLRSARIARELGVDRLLGGLQTDEILALLEGSHTSFYPFPGRPMGHPTRLAGTPDEIESHCRVFMEQGCPGANLLAYRATEADPLALVAAARRGLGENGHLIVAGSVSTPAQIRGLKTAGANAFTIGSAVFDRTFAPASGSIQGQITAVLETCADLNS